MEDIFSEFLLLAPLGLLFGVGVGMLFRRKKPISPTYTSRVHEDEEKHGFFSNPDRSDAPLARFLLLLIGIGFVIMLIFPENPSGGVSNNTSPSVGGRTIECDTESECLSVFFQILLEGE